MYLYILHVCILIKCTPQITIHNILRGLIDILHFLKNKINKHYSLCLQVCSHDRSINVTKIKTIVLSFFFMRPYTRSIISYS